jgi:hypothetical protein
LSFFRLKRKEKGEKNKSLSPSGKTTKKAQARAQALEAEKQGLRAQAVPQRLSIPDYNWVKVISP